MLISISEGRWERMINKDDLCLAINHPEYVGQYTANDFYTLQLIFQQADIRAAARRKSWRVINGGKCTTETIQSVHQDSGQLAWMF